MKSFAELFKKYRLRAEFDTIASFSDALAEKGYFYEESIFSHWQKGTRVPANRELLLTIIKIFIERQAITSVREANIFLESADQGYLTEKEEKEFHFTKQIEADIPFQVPSEIAHFTGREEIVKKISKELTNETIFLLHGSPGVGKTALAIKFGHLFRSKFKDGVLWYKVDSTNVMDILLSIALLFGEDISEIKDVEVRASIVRTLLAKKRLLIIFDNVTKKDSLKLLIPNSPNSIVMFTSHDSSLTISNKYLALPVSTFTENESLALFESILTKSFVKQNKKYIESVCGKLGKLPLALQMAANFMKQQNLKPQEYLTQLNEEAIDLKKMTYEDKNLFRAISLNFTTLPRQTREVFISLGIFEGKDFSIESLSFINKISLVVARQMIQELMDVSFIEESSHKRYRLHPLLKIFARKQLTNHNLYQRAAQYYEQLLARAEEKQCMKVLRLEVDNIIYVFKKCYDFGYWDQVITMWNPIEKFLSDVNEIKKLRQLRNTIDTSPKVNRLQKILTFCMVFFVLWWVYMFFTLKEANFWGSLFSLGYSFMAITGGIVGMLRSKSWGFLRSNIGKAIFFISSGVFCWGMGNLIWAYYNFFQSVDVPYPSLADLGFMPAYFFWISGVFYLSKSTGAKLEWKKRGSKLAWLLIPFVIIYFSYYFLFFIVDRSYNSETLLRIFFDIYYPTMDVIIVTLAVIIFGLSMNFFGGKYKLSIYSILAGFAFMYIADFIFSYTTSINVLYTGGTTDIFFASGLYLLSWGALSFYLTPNNRNV